MLLNLLGGIIGGIGLIFQGEWSLFFLGLGWSFLGVYVLSLALLPGMIFVPIAAWAEKRNNTALVLLAALPAMFWTYLVVAASCVFVFMNVVDDSDADMFHLLWGYAAATGPWAFLAREDAKTGNDHAAMTSFFAQIGVISMMVATFIEPSGTDFFRLIYWFAPALIVGVVLQQSIAWIDIRNARRGY